jgi:hypothetical protein
VIRLVPSAAAGTVGGTIAALGVIGKGASIPFLVLLLVPALMVLAAGLVILAVLLQRMLNRAIFTQDEVPMGRLERILKASSGAVAEVRAAKPGRAASVPQVRGRIKR